ncbi:MAG: lysophospholipid acyltransferase family protein [Deltaproteobacteria bacterium]|nr:lysophospholipid acyltransferase family protein [Deltaproteobacteria bacterium]
MKAFLVKLLLRASRILGGWFLRTVAYGVTAGYFLFRPGRVRASMAIYRALFPRRGRLFHGYAAWRQFADFTAGYCDRLELERGGEIGYTDEGRPLLEEAAGAGLGGILLVSHFGNPEIAARLFRRSGLPMLLLMGERDPRQVARQQGEAMERDGLDVLVSSPGKSSPFDGLEALHFLKEGGFVAMAGDLAWQEGPRLVEAPFLGGTIRLPEAPHAFALLTGAPLFTLWAFRTGRAAYRLVVSGPRYVTASSRDDRREAIRRSVRLYARELETTLKRHPWQWHVFEPVLE